jgi:hypothetical protein
MIPPSVCLIASTAFDPQCQISLLDGSSCPELERIRRLGSGLRNLSNCLLDLSVFEGNDAISASGTGSGQLYRRFDDGLEIFAKLCGEFDPDENCEIEKEIERLMNVIHPFTLLLLNLFFGQHRRN